ncbi:MAG: bifunctional protein-serine/threonine kinase/phosphatase [Pseudomonadota bacterium]
MSATLEIDYAFRTEAGDKPENADACNACVPDGQLLVSKGVAAAIADGVSSSEGGREAAEICVSGFLSDYFSTPESWTVKTATARVLNALNRWLCGQGQTQYDSPRGMVTTFSGVIVKSTTAHIVHVGDSRIWLYRNGELEQLTRDHRVWVSSDREFLARAMGADFQVDIDYRSLAVEPGDVFLFTTDGVHDFVTRKELVAVLNNERCHLQACANAIVEQSLRHGSTDNVSCQLLRVISLPREGEQDIFQRLQELPFPPDLSAGMKIDGYEILRELHSSKRSEVFLALDTESGDKVVLKTPSVNYRDDPEFLDGFLHEEWVGRRAQNAHLLKVLEPRRRRFLYNITEYVEGQSLAQWMKDTGPCDLEQARAFAGQIVEGLRALHRNEMYHQDLKPDNVLIDRHGTLKLIDFGSARIAGLGEIESSLDHHLPQGTLNYAAPECLRGEACTRQSDLYSLGVILYEMLTGKLPYGEVDRPNPRRRHQYTPASRHSDAVPEWVDGALARAVHPEPRKRYEVLSEFLFDLSHPNAALADKRAPLMERNPLLFWKGLSFALALVTLVLLVVVARG